MSKTILITGSSTGIGKATAKHFQAKGWNVIATMRSPDKETELGELDNVLVTRLDVQDQGSIDAAVAAGIEKFGKIDVLVNNAGYGAYGLLEATSIEKVQRQLDVNVVGLLRVTKALIPHMRKNKDGMIVNVSSIGGKMTFPLGTLYHGSKFAVEGMSEAMHWELAPLGIKVKIIEPGGVKTDFGSRSFDFTNDESLTEYQPMVAKLMQAMGALGASSTEASVPAEVIFNAVNDGTDTMRYTSGPDAEQFMAARKAADDATFFAGVKQQMGL